MKTKETFLKDKDGQRIPKSIPLKYRKRILYFDDERSYGNSIIISCVDGWKFINSECHTIAVDNVVEAFEALRSMERCYCEDCLKAKP